MMTLGDLLAGIQSKFGSGEQPKPTTANLPALQARYQLYAADEMTAGRTPMPFEQWVRLQQQASR